MGNSHAKSLTSNRGDKQALETFMLSSGEKEDLNTLWKAFDKDNSGEIDYDELQEIVFHLIVLFWEYSTPKKDVPKRDQLQCVIDHICENIMMEVGIIDDVDSINENDNKCDDKKLKNDNKNKFNRQVITRREFNLFGKYIMDQWAATKKKVEKKRAKSHKYTDSKVTTMSAGGSFLRKMNKNK